MIQIAVSSFVGAFAALVAFHEVEVQGKLKKYVVAFLAGLFAAVVLSYAATWVAGVFAQVGNH